MKETPHVFGFKEKGFGLQRKSHDDNLGMVEVKIQKLMPKLGFVLGNTIVLCVGIYCSHDLFRWTKPSMGQVVHTLESVVNNEMPPINMSMHSVYVSI
jgi:hypothetical protein